MSTSQTGIIKSYSLFYWQPFQESKNVGNIKIQASAKQSELETLLQKLLSLIMDNRPYCFYYLTRYKTQILLNKFLHSLDKEDENKYLQNIGQFLYEFKVQDKYSSWKVLKTKYEIRKLQQIIALKKLNKIEHTHHTYRLFNFINFNRKDAFTTNEYLEQQFQIKQLHIGQSDDIHPEIIRFFQIFHTNVEKIASFQMLKKVRGHTWIKKCKNWCCGSQWQIKRVIITSQGILEVTEDGTVTDFLKYDLFFSIKQGIQATGEQCGLALSSAQRKVVLRSLNIKQFVNFLYYSIKASEDSKQNITYSGSCPRSSHNSIKFLIDAQSYYEQVAKSLEKAQKYIYICGWWISPQLYLRRPIENDYWRLDQILKRKAQLGVKIYIIVFLSPALIPNDSYYTKKTLTSLHPNITVQRHPHQFLPKLWSHHEKMVIIDQKIALMGGLDLCYGRYDSLNHPINNNSKNMYPGIDYNNIRKKDFFQVRQFEKDIQDRNLPRLPWHDVAYRVIGRMVLDASNHFVQYWNFVILQKSIAPIVAKNKQASDMRQNLQATTNTILTLTKQQKDILGFLLKFANQKQLKRIQDFIQNKSRREKILKFLRAEWLQNRFQLNNGPGENSLILSIQGLNLLKEDRHTKQYNRKIMVDELQMLRSASEWSIGLEQGVIQRSIQNAYLSMIKNAKNFIYIQNQFFISATGQKESFVQNQIANSLYERIKKAIQKNQKFRVIIFMPLLPGMQGQLTENCPLALSLTIFWQYNTISQSSQALLPRVAKLTEHPQDYIEFYSLRAHGILNNQPVTQIIYIHTKLIIVDDHIALCGSANINDRSMEGDKDSQLAVILTSGQKIAKKTNGTRYQVNRRAYELRSQLFKQHFGINEREAEDPLSEHTINLMRNISKINTEAYRQIFGCCPDDNVKNLSETSKFLKPNGPELHQRYKALSPNIQGHVVQFPTQFLSKQKLYRIDLDKFQDIFT